MAPPINKSGAMPNSSWELETFKYNPFQSRYGIPFRRFKRFYAHYRSSWIGKPAQCRIFQVPPGNFLAPAIANAVNSSSSKAPMSASRHDDKKNN